MELAIGFGALCIALIAPWARYYVLTAQIATFNLRTSRELAEAGFEETKDLREKVEYLYAKYTTAEANLTKTQRALKDERDQRARAERESQERLEALVETEKVLRVQEGADAAE